MANDANAGTLSVAITGDISNLLDALNQAQAAATTAGEAIASALTKPLSSADLNIGTTLDAQFQTAEEAAQSAGAAIADALDPIATDAATASEAISNIGESLTDVAPEAADAADSIQDIATALDDASTSATDAAAAIDDTVSSADDLGDATSSTDDLSSSLETVGAAAETAGAGVEGAGAGAVAAGAEAAEASGMFAEFGEELTAIAETIGIGLGIEELGKEAIEASSQVQQLTTSFTFLSGSADTASDEVEQLKEMALELNQPFSEVASAAQAMTAKLGGFNEAVPLLEDAANAAQVVGSSFDAVSAKLTQMALSGTASARTLATIGLSTDDLAASMNKLSGSASITADNVTAAFKALDQSDRIAVIQDAMSKWDSASQQFSSDMSQQWANFRTQFEFDLEEAGNALQPFISSLETAMTGLLKAISPVADALATLISQALADNISAVSGAVNTLFNSFTSLGDALSPISGYLGPINKAFDDLVGMNLPDFFKNAATQIVGMVTGLQQVHDVITLAAAAIELATGRASSFSQAVLAVEYSENQMLPPTNAAAAATTAAGNAASDSAAKHITLGSAVGTAATATGEFVQAVKSSQGASVELNDALLQIANGFGTLTPLQVDWNAAVAANANEIHGAMTDYDQWNQDLNEVAHGGLPQVITEYDNLNEALNNLGGTMTSSGTQALIQESALGELKNGVVVLTGAVADETTKFDGYGLAIGTVGQTVINLNGSVTNLAGAVEKSNADWEAAATKAESAADAYNDAANATTNFLSASYNAVDAFNAIANAAQQAMQDVDGLTDAMVNATKASSGMKGGGGGGNASTMSAWFEDVASAKNSPLASVSGGIEMSQLDQFASSIGLIGNQGNYETLDQLNTQLQQSGSVFTASLNTMGGVVLTATNAESSNTKATSDNTTATASNTTSTTASTSATTAAASATAAATTATTAATTAMTTLPLQVSGVGTASTTTAASLDDLSAAATTAATATSTTTTASGDFSSVLTQIAGDTGETYEQLAEQLERYGTVTTDASVDTDTLGEALVQLTQGSASTTQGLDALDGSVSMAAQSFTSNAALDAQTVSNLNAAQQAYTSTVSNANSAMSDFVKIGLSFVGAAQSFTDNASLDAQTVSNLNAAQQAYTSTVSNANSAMSDFVKIGLSFVGQTSPGNLNANAAYAQAVSGQPLQPGQIPASGPGAMSSPWTPPTPTSFWQAMGWPSAAGPANWMTSAQSNQNQSMGPVTINVLSPTMQSTANQIVSALRNNANLKI